jgi:hypothetical protein
MVEQWYIDPKSGSVVSPTGAANPGCQPVIALVPVTKSIAKVFCGDGTIRATNDAGTSWLDAGRLGKVTSAVFTGALVGYASTERPGCKSRIQATVDGGLTWTPRGCIVETVAVPAFTGREKQLIAGGPGGVRVSSDGGSTWTPPTLK